MNPPVLDTQPNILTIYSSILEEAMLLLNTNAFPIYRLSTEPEPDSILYTWQLKDKSKEEIKSGSVLIKPKLTDKDKNFSCKLCPNKLSGIPDFKKEGKIPILVIHYTGEHRKGQKQFIKKNKSLIFRTEEAEDIFNRMIQKSMGVSYKDFYYQEYPACTFNHDKLEANDWKLRVDNCKVYIEEVIQEKKIKAIIMIGSPATFYFGQEGAMKNADKLLDFDFSGIKIKGVVLRSPEALLQIENQKKDLASSPESPKYKEALEKEKKIKKQIVEQLQKLKQEVISV